MLIATAIFLFVMVIAVGSLVSMVGANRKAQSVALVTDNLRFVTDDMSRTLRTGIDFDGNSGNGCVSGRNATDCYGGTREVAVTDQDGKRVKYRFSTAAQCNIGGGGFASGCIMRSDNGGVFMPVTSPDLEVDVANISTSRFYVRGSIPGAADSRQPVVTVLLQARITKGLSTPTLLHLQTSATQRIYDN